MKKKKRQSAEEKEYYHPMVKQLKDYKKNGIMVTLEGVPVPVEEIARTCAIRERGAYMGDYITDEQGRLIEVRFDRID